MPIDRQQLRRALLRLAGSQHGYFTAAQALSVGYSYQAQKFHADRGNWQRVDRGLFRLPDWPVSDQDHLVRWSLWAAGAAVVSHESALAQHSLGDVNPARLHLTVPPGFRRQDPAVVLHRAALRPAEIEDRDGFRVTTPVRALAECSGAGMAQEGLASAVADALVMGVTPRALRDAAAGLGARAELGIERALNSVSARS